MEKHDSLNDLKNFVEVKNLMFLSIYFFHNVCSAARLKNQLVLTLRDSMKIIFKNTYFGTQETKIETKNKAFFALCFYQNSHCC